jgi:ABC-2 type transport system ATP-binding protein
LRLCAFAGKTFSPLSRIIRTVLTVDSIEKKFAHVVAVDKLSFDVREGEIFALIGPNGAGKTTTVRMLTGIIKPDAGTIHYSLNHEKPGYLPEERGLYKDMPILETLVHMAVLRGMKRIAARAAAMQWLDRVSLQERALDKLDTLSKGNQQKVQFISAVLHRPRFIILDEPFSGLDPINQELFSQLIRQLRDEGATILLSAHQMQLIERIADRLLLMNRGRTVLYGTMDEIRKSGPWANAEQITLHEIYVHAVGEDVAEVNN